ncbi:MAG: ABC transporter permease [Motiliproteus sp.]|nr:ABC transporter permease [Motiliproteus sp.]MCW9051785.1 ABC transporter permease [Motiliproteus sp.]
MAVHNAVKPQSYSTAAGMKRTSLWFLLIAALCLLLADLEVIRADPWMELGRIGLGLITPNFFATEALLDALLNTLAFALIGVTIANCVGFLLALLFNKPGVRQFCASIRAVHELFWALLFLQIFGLSTLTGILAIAIPYSGIFAKVYAEILEESDHRPINSLPKQQSLSAFFYARFAIAYPHFRSYCLYRLECGIRSSAILGFIGLPTLGFHLDTAFKQGNYSEAAALLYLFFIVIATLRQWMRLKLLPVYLAAGFYILPQSTLISLEHLKRFLGEDIIPSPLRQSGGDFTEQILALMDWCWQLLYLQAFEGVFNTIVLSIIALVGSGMVALLLFPLVSRHFFSRPGRGLGHALLVVFRSIPELILTFITTLILGPSMLPAILALSLHNGAIIGYLIGQHSNGLQLRADSSRGLNLYSYELLPRIYPQFLAFLLYRWEVIVRETAILGVLGIHTLGFYIDSAFEDLRFDRALFLILITAALNLSIDSLSRWLRSRIHRVNFERVNSC